ncbi:MAG TPA: Gfo/Idh/MocA family oxidoreductase [Candidatus Obscuribacterales bacterium]
MDTLHTLEFGLIGCGHWGPNYARLLQTLPGCRLRRISDLNPERLNALTGQYPQVQADSDAAALLADPEIKAVIVATPASTHYLLVKAALEAGKHVLCEKPLTLDPAQSRELSELAAASGQVLMVGHTFLFNSGIRQLKRYLDEGLLGQLYYIHATRTNLGPIRQDVNAVADLATHDIAIFNFLLDAMPEQVSAQGQSWLQPGIEDLAFMTLQYPGRILAHVHASWLNPVKVRTLTLVGSKKMVVWDDMNPSEPIRIYDVGVIQEPYYQDFGQFQLLPRQGDTTIPRVALKEPLKQEVEAFVSAVRSGQQPVSDGPFATGVVEVLSAIDASLRQHGTPVKLGEGRGARD